MVVFYILAKLNEPASPNHTTHCLVTRILPFPFQNVVRAQLAEDTSDHFAVIKYDSGLGDEYHSAHL